MEEEIGQEAECQAQAVAGRDSASMMVHHASKLDGLRVPLRAQRSDQNLCTLVAIARAIGILECRAVQAGLETLLRVLVERTFWSRGMLAGGRCTTAGIPPEAFCR